MVLQSVKPINELLCDDELKKPHTWRAEAFLRAFCDNLPDNIPELVRQAVEVFKALRKEDQDHVDDRVRAPLLPEDRYILRPDSRHEAYT